MSIYEEEKIDKISHHIESLSTEMHEVKKAILEEKKIKEKLAKKDKKRRDSLKKAQKKFKNISTNFKIEDFEEIKKRLDELNISSSSYLQKLVTIDLEEHIIE
jgi:uncharacterized protein YpbB